MSKPNLLSRVSASFRKPSLPRVGFLLLVGISLLLPALPAHAAPRRVDTDPYSLIAAVNSLRAAHGLAPYSINATLMAIAQQHAEFMSVNGVSHYGYGGTRPYERALNAGYPLAGDLSLGGFMSENITAGGSKSVQDAVQEWQGDAPHLNTMLSANLQEIGAGVVVVGEYVYYVIDCAKPSGSSISYTPAAPSSSGGGLLPGVTPGIVVINTLLPNTPDSEGKIYHKVQSGETLWLIAVSYGITAAQIRQLNNMTEEEAIYPGETLLLMQLPTPTATATLTPTIPATYTPFPTLTPQPIPTATPQPLTAPAIPKDSGLLIAGAILLAALALAGILAKTAKITR